MKTAYCTVHRNCGVIRFTDEFLARTATLQLLVRDSCRHLSKDMPWSESVSATIEYGKITYEKSDDGVLRRVPSANGPVLVYGWYNTPGERCTDTTVTIHVGQDGTTVETTHEEGSESALGYDSSSTRITERTIESIPDVFFSEEFLNAWCEILNGHRFPISKEVVHVIEDMPKEHRALLDEKAKAHMEKNKEWYDLQRKNDTAILRDECDDIVSGVKKRLAGEKLRIGLDYHGVIDRDPDYFSVLSCQVINDGGEVHVLTGQRDDNDLRNKLDDLGISFTHLFSIISHHESAKTRVWKDERGWWMDEETWDRSKAAYCLEHGIHVHFDDSKKYGRHFKPSTLYVKYPECVIVNKKDDSDVRSEP